MAVATERAWSPLMERVARRAMSSCETRVVQIGGANRSGTTLLEHLLADRMGAVALGEVHHVFQRGVIENQRCSCGAPFWECDWWSQTAETVFGTPERARARVTKIVEQQWSSVRRYPAVRARRSTQLPVFESIVADLFTVLAEQAGGRWLIDSSKDPSWFEITGRVAHRTELVHVVRDIRGVVASHRRRVVRPEIIDRTELMPRCSVMRTAAEWTVFNGLTALVRSADNYRQVRYEDLCADPESTLELLRAEFALNERRRPPVFHSVSGNPMRFSATNAGPIEVKLDDGWRSELPLSLALTARALTAPAGLMVDAIGRRRSADRFNTLRASLPAI